MKTYINILTIVTIAITMFGFFQITKAQWADGWVRTYSTMASDSIYVHTGGSQGSGYATRVEATSDQVSDSIIYSRKVPLTIFDGTIMLDRRILIPIVEHWLSLAIHHGDTTIKTLSQTILSEDTIFGGGSFNDWDNTLSAFDSISLIIFATDYIGTQIADFDNFRNGAGTIFYDGGELGEINGTVFYDKNQNSARDTGEEGLCNWKMYLINQIASSSQYLSGLLAMTTTVDSTTTDDLGHYIFPAVPRGNYTLRISTHSGWIATLPTNGDTAITVSDNKLDWQLNFGEYTPLAYYMTVNSKWNMVALPKRAYESSVNALFPTAISNAFSYNGNYQSCDTLKVGVGYWLKFPESTSVIIVGDSIIADTITVQEGWNMVSGLTETISVNDIMVDPPTMITSQFFAYDGSYITADSIKPGLGYWVKASEAGELMLNAGSKAFALNRIRIVDRGETPPPPPESNEIPSSNKFTTYMLEQNYPNPFNPITNFRFSIVNPQLTILKIYDVLGREVATLVNEMKQPGTYTVQWNPSASLGQVPSGIYFYRLSSGSFIETKKLILLK